MIKYHALIKIAELGSISKAATALDYTQPGLSYILSSFEEELGFKLFIRKRSGIKLTEDGKKVLLFASADEMEILPFRVLLYCILRVSFLYRISLRIS